jgi:hypothetical protein
LGNGIITVQNFAWRVWRKRPESGGICACGHTARVPDPRERTRPSVKLREGVSDGVASIHYPEPGAEDQPLVDTAVERVLPGAWENQSASIEAARIGVPPNLPNRSSFISLGEPGLEGQVLTINLVLQTEPGGRKPERFCIMYIGRVAQ